MNQELSFPAHRTSGSVRQCFPIFSIDNDIVDGDRTLSLALTSSNPRVLNSSVQIIIKDDEGMC